MTARTVATTRDYAHRAAPVAALIGVNLFAVTGTGQWAYAYLGHDPYTATAFAVVLESIALFLTGQATRAMLADLRSAPLRLAAYTLAAGVGVMNYVAHAGPGLRPTPMALAFGVLSASSPWLWTVWARGTHQIALRDKGLIDPRAVHFALTLWILHPYRTARATWHATWQGVQDPMAARAYLAERDAVHALAHPDAIRYALAALDTRDTHTARVWLQARGVQVSQAAVAEVAAEAAEAPRRPARGPLPVPVSPAPLPVPVSPAPAPTAPLAALPGPGSDDWHRDRLAEARTGRDRIRYALTHLGPDAGPATVRAWLAGYGYAVPRSEVQTVRASLPPSTRTAPAVPVTPLNGRRVAALISGE